MNQALEHESFCLLLIILKLFEIEINSVLDLHSKQFETASVAVMYRYSWSVYIQRINWTEEKRSELTFITTDCDTFQEFIGSRESLQSMLLDIQNWWQFLWYIPTTMARHTAKIIQKFSASRLTRRWQTSIKMITARYGIIITSSKNKLVIKSPQRYPTMLKVVLAGASLTLIPTTPARIFMFPLIYWFWSAFMIVCGIDCVLAEFEWSKKLIDFSAPVLIFVLFLDPGQYLTTKVSMQ